MLSYPKAPIKPILNMFPESYPVTYKKYYSVLVSLDTVLKNLRYPDLEYKNIYLDIHSVLEKPSQTMIESFNKRKKDWDEAEETRYKMELLEFHRECQKYEIARLEYELEKAKEKLREMVKI